jgi:hypothetical protein
MSAAAGNTTKASVISSRIRSLRGFFAIGTSLETPRLTSHTITNWRRVYVKPE